MKYSFNNLPKIAMGDAPKPLFTAEEKKIIAAIPSYPGDKQIVPREQIFLEAKELVRVFVDKAERYDRDKLEADRPNMSLRTYIEPIVQNLHLRANRYLYFDKNPAYQVLFVMCVLMRLPSRKHTWWEEKLAESIPIYLDTTRYFKACKALIDTAIADVVAISQPTLDFGPEPVRLVTAATAVENGSSDDPLTPATDWTAINLWLMDQTEIRSHYLEDFSRFSTIMNDYLQRGEKLEMVLNYLLRYDGKILLLPRHSNGKSKGRLDQTAIRKGLEKAGFPFKKSNYSKVLQGK